MVEDDHAYITTRSGSPCGSGFNELTVVNISDIHNPVIEANYDMAGPYGLGIDGSTLFICDGTSGLKVYDASDVLNIDDNMLSQFSSIDAFDVIPFNNVLMTTAKEGIYQYNYSDPQDITLLSSILTE